MEDVPEEPDVEQEEPKEPSVQNMEPKPQPETPAHNLEPVLEPVKEPIPALVSPPVEPVQTAAPAPVPPAPGLQRVSVESAGAVLEPDLPDGGSGQMKNKQEEEREEAEGCAAPVKEGNICEHQEGMSTQQVEKHTCCEENICISSKTVQTVSDRCCF